MRPLPTPVQWSPLFGMGISDFNGDGHEDLVGSQNFYGVSERDSRQDAGEGFLLLGKGDGTFEWVDSTLSGIDLPGEGRGLAVADFNRSSSDFVAIQRCPKPGCGKTRESRHHAGVDRHRWEPSGHRTECGGSTTMGPRVPCARSIWEKATGLNPQPAPFWEWPKSHGNWRSTGQEAFPRSLL